MKKLSTFVYCVLIVAAAVAAPTANEDFVIAEDAQTFTNAVNAAKLYTDTSTNAAVRAAKRYTDAATAGYAAVSNAAMNAAERLRIVSYNEWVYTNRFTDSVSRLVYRDGHADWVDDMFRIQYARVPDSDTPHWWYLTDSEASMDIRDVKYTATIPDSLTLDGMVFTRHLGTETNVVLYSNATAADIGAVPTTRKINGQPLTADITIASGVTSVNGATGTVTLAASDVGAVPTTRKINGQPLTGDITIASGVTSVNGATGTVTLAASDVGAVPVTRKINGQPLTADITIASGVTSVNGATGTVTLAASDVGAYSSTAGNTLAGQVATIGAHLNAEDARFVVTNYNSETHTPEAYVEIQLPDTSWSRIWSEMTRWNWLFDHYLPTNYYDKAAVNAALAEKADRAWGFYDSTTGEYAPDGYTWISSEKIAIAANLAYQRTVTSEGAIWVLESNGVVTETGGMTNGFFRISDDEGNSLFEIVKGNKRTVGADASSCQVVAGFTPTKLQIGYSIVSDVHPTLYVCQSLATQDWKAETDSDCIANVTWSGTSGAYVAQVQGKSAYSSMFVKATYEVGGETYISNAAPVSMQYIMIGGVKYAVGVGTVSGTTVLTLTVAP